MEAGELRDRVQVLTLRKAGDQYQWTPSGAIWAKVELTGKTNLFSAVGIGARDALITLRRRSLCLHQALLWRGRHLFLTEVLPPEGSFMTVRAAVVELGVWTKLGDGADDLHFPAVITEKYVRYAQEEPMASHTVTYVLVTPKDIQLGPSDLVSNVDTKYVVTACHTIDPWKNEYEIVHREEP